MTCQCGQDHEARRSSQAGVQTFYFDGETEHPAHLCPDCGAELKARSFVVGRCRIDEDYCTDCGYAR